MGAAAGAAAAVIIRREKDLIEHFRRAGATTPQTAQSPDALGVEQDNIWRILTRRAVIRPGANGAYYLDEATWEALGNKRRRLAIVIAAFMILLSMVALLVSSMAIGASRR